jgi:hypothetical protein
VSETREWLERLYGSSPGYFAVTAFAGGKPRATKWFATTELDVAAKTIKATARRADVYVSMATYAAPPADPRSRGRQKDVLSIPGFWADLDIGEAGHKPAELPNPPDESSALSIIDSLPAPSLVEHSGGGLQAFWLFDSPWVLHDDVDRHEARQASDGWQQLLAARGRDAGYNVDTVPDLTRVFRVPGSLNHKLDEARPVQVRTLDGPAHPSSLLASLGEPARERAALKPGEVASDDFPLTWGEILEPHGWSPCHSSEGVGHWARPGKKCSEGHSATTDVYGVPVMVVHSASVDLPQGDGQRLTKLRVYAHLNFGGDLGAAKDALKALKKSTPEDWAAVAHRFQDSKVDWPRLWADEDPEPEWIIEPVLTRGGQAVLYSEPKAGKSLVSLEWVMALALGRPVMGNPEREALSIVYIDQENTPKDLRRNGGDFGYLNQEIPGLHYYLFPSLAFLDTEEGGRQIHALAKYHAADLVVLDTLSRVVEGNEEDSNTYHSFYKYTGVLLKADAIALLRLDHSGKDKGKGMRGSSAKASDVDYVWELVADGEGCGALVTLTRTHSRSPYGDRVVTLTRECEPLRHDRIITDQALADSLDVTDQTHWMGDIDD